MQQTNNSTNIEGSRSEEGQLSTRMQSILRDEYISKFMATKEQLMKRWLLMDRVKLLTECEHLRIEQTRYIGKTSS